MDKERHFPVHIRVTVVVGVRIFSKSTSPATNNSDDNNSFFVRVALFPSEATADNSSADYAVAGSSPRRLRTLLLQ